MTQAAPTVTGCSYAGCERAAVVTVEYPPEQLGPHDENPYSYCATCFEGLDDEELTIIDDARDGGDGDA